MAAVNVLITPAEVNLAGVQGDYWEFTIQVPSDVDGEYVDFSGYTFLSQIRTNALSDTVLATFDVAATGATVTTYGITVSLDATDTATLPQQAVWDLKVINGASEPRTYFAGVVDVTYDVSRTP